MRIIAGKYKRRVLKTPSNLPVRPTTDLAKEALFNVLNNHIDFEAVQVLDLFSGTGNISLEFASRGAIHVLAVDNNPLCAAYVKRVIHELGFSNMHFLRADALKFIGSCRTRFDLIFADPPYDFEGTKSIPGLVFDRGLLAENGHLIIEHGPTTSFNDHLRLTEKRKYGKVHFSFFQ